MNHSRAQLLLIGLLLVGSVPAVQAATTPAGRALFVDGIVNVASESSVRGLNQGDRVYGGDRVQTAVDARAHLRMLDKTLISLRPDTEFEIDRFEYGAGTEARSQGGAAQGFFRLFRGAMRAITGGIARVNREQFRVETRIATIGIRGTTFDVACINACEEGVVFGVLDGSIVATTQAGSLVLEAGEYGFARSPSELPVRLIAAPQALRDDISYIAFLDKKEAGERRPADEAKFDEIETHPGFRKRATFTEEDHITDATENPFETARRDLAFAAGPLGADDDGASLASSGPSSVFGSNSQGELDSFIGPYPADADAAAEIAQYRLISGSGRLPDSPDSKGDQITIDASFASNQESGFDPDTSISWGRWGGGIAEVEREDGSVETLDLNQSSLHWIISGFSDTSAALPTQGSLSFDLFGNTDPTSDTGERGVLGAATLDANFTNGSVDSTLELFINNSSWSAAGTGDLGVALSPETPAGVFAGDYTSVTIDGSPSGGGAFSGFIIGGARGAGLSYSLNGTDDSGLSIISGTAAFRASPEGVIND